MTDDQREGIRPEDIPDVEGHGKGGGVGNPIPRNADESDVEGHGKSGGVGNPIPRNAEEQRPGDAHDEDVDGHRGLWSDRALKRDITPVEW